MIILALSGLLLLDTNTPRTQNNRIQPSSSRSPFRTSDFRDSSFPAEERHRYRARDRHSLHSASNRPIPNAVTKTEYGVQVAPFCLPPNLRDSYHLAMRSNTPRSRQADERLSFKSRSPQSKKAGRQAHPPTLNVLASPRLIAPLPRRTPSPPTSATPSDLVRSIMRRPHSHPRVSHPCSPYQNAQFLQVLTSKSTEYIPRTRACTRRKNGPRRGDITQAYVCQLPALRCSLSPVANLKLARRIKSTPS